MKEKIRKMNTSGDLWKEHGVKVVEEDTIDLDQSIPKDYTENAVSVSLKVHKDMLGALDHVRRCEGIKTRSEVIRTLLTTSLNAYEVKTKRGFTYDPITGSQYDIGDSPDKGKKLSCASGDIEATIKDMSERPSIYKNYNKYIEL